MGDTHAATSEAAERRDGICGVYAEPDRLIHLSDLMVVGGKNGRLIRFVSRVHLEQIVRTSRGTSVRLRRPARDCVGPWRSLLGALQHSDTADCAPE